MIEGSETGGIFVDVEADAQGTFAGLSGRHPVGGGRRLVKGTKLREREARKRLSPGPVVARVGRDVAAAEASGLRGPVAGQGLAGDKIADNVDDGGGDRQRDKPGGGAQQQRPTTSGVAEDSIPHIQSLPIRGDERLGQSTEAACRLRCLARSRDKIDYGEEALIEGLEE